LEKFKDFKGVEHRRIKLKEYLEFLDEDGNAVGSKLKLGELNDEFFKEYIVDNWDKTLKEKEEIVKKFKVRNEYNASRRIKEAYEYILKKMLEEIKDLDEEVAIERIKAY